MMKLYFLFFISVFTSLSNDLQNISTQITPTSSELLSVPIILDKCPGLNVVEWRPKPTKKEILLLNNICYKVFSNFEKFVNIHGFSLVKNTTSFFEKISLIPAKRELGGFLPRNLNDDQFRFKSRVKSFDSNGNLYSIWGYTDYTNNIFFVRSDIFNNGLLNNKFVTVFAHELYHVLSFYYKIPEQYQEDDKQEKDELMAQYFTQYLDYGR